MVIGFLYRLAINILLVAIPAIRTTIGSTRRTTQGFSATIACDQVVDAVGIPACVIRFHLPPRRPVRCQSNHSTCGSPLLPPSHSVRRGHPAAIHARSSSRRQRVERPIRTGRGIQPRESHVRHVRRDLLQSIAALLAPTRRTSPSAPSSLCLGRTSIVSLTCSNP